MSWRHVLLTGDCRAVMATFPENSADAIVTDPPYGLEFMGKGWDKGVPGPDFWTEALRVAKPGAYLVAFGGDRTWHRLAVAIEDAGWEIRGNIAWIYGQGFPKSPNVSKALSVAIASHDQCACDGSSTEIAPSYQCGCPACRGSGDVRLRFGSNTDPGDVPSRSDARAHNHGDQLEGDLVEGRANTFPGEENARLATFHSGTQNVQKEDSRSCDSKPSGTATSTSPALQQENHRKGIGIPGMSGSIGDSVSSSCLRKRYPHIPQCSVCGKLRIPQGLGTATKPAFEPVIMARKPLIGTVAANVLQYGTGALNIDACRIATGEEGSPAAKRRESSRLSGNAPMSGKLAVESDAEGRIGRRGSAEVYMTERPGESLGRWPANVVLDQEAAAQLDEQTGAMRSGVAVQRNGGGQKIGTGRAYRGSKGLVREDVGYGDTVGASRFFSVIGRDCSLCCLPVHRHVTASTCSERGAKSVERSSTVIRAIVESFAPRIVQPRLVEQLAPLVPFADALCDSCATSIAAIVAEIRHLGFRKEEYGLFLDSIPSSSASILIRNLASCAPLLGSIDITQTTESLWLLCGSVLRAIESSTSLESLNAGNARFLYQAKASRSERDAGLESIAPEQRDESRKEGNPGGNNPRNRGAKEVANFHPCLRPGSLVLTEHGWCSIDSVSSGDRVVGADGALHVVTEVSSHRYGGPLYRIMAADKSVEATNNHPFLVLREGVVAWVEAVQVRPGDYTLTPENALDTVKPPWEIADQRASTLAAKGTPPTKATTGSTETVDSAWLTMSSGSLPTGPFQPGSGSIIGTRTSRTITCRISNWSMPLRTSGFTPVASSVEESGGSHVACAVCSSLSRMSTGTSPRVTRPTGDADRAISGRSSGQSRFVLHCVEKVEPVAYVGEVWNLTVEGNPTFQTEIGMSHNTVKPVDLMRWLVRLVTPPRGIVLDPFMGSGSTGVACRLEGVGFVGIDQEPRYVEIARLRCARE